MIGNNNIPPLRFATVHVRGKKAINEDMDVKRLSTLLDATSQIEKAKWKLLDGVILPDGYFHHSYDLDAHGYSWRKRLLETSLYHDFVLEALEILHPKSPHAYIITGMVPPPVFKQTREKFLCCWNKNGITDIGHTIRTNHVGNMCIRLQWTYPSVWNDDEGPSIKAHDRQNGIRLACSDASDCGETADDPLRPKHSIKFRRIASLPVSHHTDEALCLWLFEGTL